METDEAREMRQSQMCNDNCGKGRPKPGVDWKAIEAAVRAGVSYSSIAKQFPVTRQRIGQVAKERGWTDPPSVSGGLSEHLSGRDSLSPENILGRPFLEVLKDQNWGKLSDRTIQIILALVSAGYPESAAVEYCGIPRVTWYDRCTKEPSLKALVLAARSSGILNNFTTLKDGAKRGDWRASKELLAMNPDTREDYGDSKHAEKGQLIVHLNIPDPGSMDGRAVDATPEPVVIECATSAARSAGLLNGDAA